MTMIAHYTTECECCGSDVEKYAEQDDHTCICGEEIGDKEKCEEQMGVCEYCQEILDPNPYE